MDFKEELENQYEVESLIHRHVFLYSVIHTLIHREQFVIQCLTERRLQPPSDSVVITVCTV